MDFDWKDCDDRWSIVVRMVRSHQEFDVLREVTTLVVPAAVLALLHAFATSVARSSGPATSQGLLPTSARTVGADNGTGSAPFEEAVNRAWMDTWVRGFGV